MIRQARDKKLFEVTFVADEDIDLVYCRLAVNEKFWYVAHLYNDDAELLPDGRYEPKSAGQIVFTNESGEEFVTTVKDITDCLLEQRISLAFPEK